MTHQNPTKDQVADARARIGDEGKPTKKPDYLLEGRVFDCYSPGEMKPPRGIWVETRNKIDKEQTQRVVINLQDWDGDLDALRRQFATWPISGLKEVKVITRDTHEVLQLPHA
jgi:hypothetical protein